MGRQNGWMDTREGGKERERERERELRQRIKHCLSTGALKANEKLRQQQTTNANNTNNDRGD
jgi:hypothetical protein